MEIKVVEESKKKLIFEIIGESHTMANLLEKELWEDKDVVAAGYHIDHPLFGVPRMIVEAPDPRKALEKAIKRLKKKNADFAKAFKSKAK